MKNNSYIIPHKFFTGDFGKLKKEDKALWDALIDRDRLDWTKKKEEIDKWLKDHDML